MGLPALTSIVMAGLDPASHCSGLVPASAADARDKPGHDEGGRRRSDKVEIAS
jgi:hypothetical protein